MRVKDAVGRFGEQVAVEHLEAHGLAVVERNWRCRDGEIDIIARDGSDLVFIEVKTRSTARYGSPAQAMTPAKVARIRRLGLRWLAEHRDDAFWERVRFDVIGVVRRDGPDGMTVTHLRGAF